MARMKYSGVSNTHIHYERPSLPPVSRSGRIEQCNLSGSVMLSGRKPLCWEGNGLQKLTLLKVEKI